MPAPGPDPFQLTRAIFKVLEAERRPLEVAEIARRVKANGWEADDERMLELLIGFKFTADVENQATSLFVDEGGKQYRLRAGAKPPQLLDDLDRLELEDPELREFLEKSRRMKEERKLPPLMALTFHYEPEDFIAVSRLRLRPMAVPFGPVLALVGVVAAIVLGQQGWLIATRREWEPVMLFIGGILALFLAHYFWLIPWRERQAFRAIPALHGPQKLSFRELFITLDSGQGTRETEWEKIESWKFDGSVVLLNHEFREDCTVIPNRAIADPETRAKVLGLIEQKLGRPGDRAKAHH